MRPIDTIVVHCSDSDFGSAALVDEWHRGYGWKCIGYHYVILNGVRSAGGEYLQWVDGVIEKGRPESEIGAHVKGHNGTSLGICLIGRRQFTPIQLLESLPNLLEDLMKRFGLGLENLWAHNDLDHMKICPGFDLGRYLRALDRGWFWEMKRQTKTEGGKKTMKRLLIVSLLIFGLLGSGCVYIRALKGHSWLLLEKAFKVCILDRDNEFSGARYIPGEKKVVWITPSEQSEPTKWFIGIMCFETRADLLVLTMTYYFYQKEGEKFQKSVQAGWAPIWSERHGVIIYLAFRPEIFDISKADLKKEAEPYLRLLLEERVDFYQAQRQAARDLGLIKDDPPAKFI